MVRKILITGGSGLLGKYLIATAPRASCYEIHATYDTNNVESRCVELYDTYVTWHHMHMPDAESIKRVFDAAKPNIVIHTAAIGSVDYCEAYKADAITTNLHGSMLVSAAAQSNGAKCIYISSNAVYSGKNAPYTADAPQHPINYYGFVKHATERSLQDGALIIRPILLYGWPWNDEARPNWVVTILKNLRVRYPMKIVGDTVTQPTYAADCAKFAWHAIANDLVGAFNFAVTYPISLHSFAQIVARVFDLPGSLISEAKSSDFPNMAPRPVDTTYDVSKLLQAGYDMPLVSGLLRMKDDK